MTSKNLFFKLMMEDLKRKFWAIGLAFLSFFFSMPVNVAMSISNLQRTYRSWITNGTTFGEGITADIRYGQKLLGIVETTLGLENVLNAAVIAAASITMALTGFMYLHSRKQVDFYHSIPVRREVLFAVKYVNGILIILSMYLLNMILAVGILGVNGVGLSAYGSAALITVIVHLGGFLVNYGLMVIAVILTGNFFISILGGMVLFAYIPAVVTLVQALMSLFFETLDMRGMKLDQMMVNGSPISSYINLVTDGAGLKPDQYGMILGTAGIMILVGIAMTAAALFLYKKRPSESAGKAMAFSITKTPIKILLVVPITVASALLFWSIYYDLAWAGFGFVIGLAVTHAIVEIIYHFEFAKLFSNLHHMAVCAVFALAILVVFRYDLVGFDSYKPTEKEFKSAAIYVNGIRENLDYGEPYEYESNGTTHLNWNYMMMEQYALDHMKFTDYEIVSKLADSGIRESKRLRNALGSEEYKRDANGFWTSVVIAYHVKNGKTVYRHYDINVTDLRNVFDQMYESEEYKNGSVPLLAYDADDVYGIYESHDSRIYEIETDTTLRAQMLDAYKEEMTALTLDERAQTTPVTSLRFMTHEEYEYICSISHQRNPNFAGDFQLEDMNRVNFFPVYPSFTKTLELLEQAGMDEFGPLDMDDVYSIEIVSDYYVDEKAYYDAPASYYEETVEVYSMTGVQSAEAKSYPVMIAAQDGIRTITLENDGTEGSEVSMKQVLDVIVNRELAQMNGLQPLEYGMTVRVYMKDANKEKSVHNREFENYLFPADQIPQFVKDAFKV